MERALRDVISNHSDVIANYCSFAKIVHGWLPVDFQEVTVCSFDREADRGVLGLCIEMNKMKKHKEKNHV